MDSPLLRRLGDGIAAERRAQRDEHRRLLAMSLSDRVTLGVTWVPLTVENQVPGRRTLVVLRGRDLHDGIESGDPVMIGPVGAPDDGVRGLCIGTDRGAAEILIDDELDEGWDEVAVTRLVDEITLDRYRAALQAADEHDSSLKRVLIGEQSPSEAVPTDHPFPELNDSQRTAARLALGCEEVAVIHGPPGTGKTHVMASLLEALVAEGERPWALADSNAAVDNLAVRASFRGLDVVRLGHAARIGSAAAALGLDARIARHPLAKAMETIERELSRLRSIRMRGADYAERKRLYRELYRLRDQAREQILQSADVLASTLGTLSKRAANLPEARTALIDEATQALEPAVWVPVPFVERLILVGDPHQLGPVVVSRDEVMERSMLARLLDESEVVRPMLAVQHRMHQNIQDLLEPLYPGLQPHPSVAEHLLRDLPGVDDTPLTGRPCLWVDTAGAGLDEARDPATLSLYNAGEITLIGSALAQLIEAGVPREDIGVITPYSAQVSRLSEQFPKVEIATVNSFQGREKEAILCSFVRSNPDGDVGFNADIRRLTVATSRARRLLLCVGDSATLSTVPRFAEVMEHFEVLDSFTSVWVPPWSDALPD